MGKPIWVSASDIGRAAFCGHYLEHKRKNTPVSKQAIHARARGVQAHEQFTIDAQDSRCFIASHLYGEYDERTNLLRSFRDSRLLTNCVGRPAVLLYYRFSPNLVRLARRHPALNRSLKRIVDWIVLKIGML